MANLLSFKGISENFLIIILDTFSHINSFNPHNYPIRSNVLQFIEEKTDGVDLDTMVIVTTISRTHPLLMARFFSNAPIYAKQLPRFKGQLQGHGTISLSNHLALIQH